MRKKGFTLVELLAVIAILAILVIIALPNVMGMFNQAKQNSFTTEVKNILKQAGQQWVTDGSMSSSTTALCYGRGVTGPTKELLLSGRTNLKYAVCLNKAGQITQFAATDDTYVVSYSDDSNPLNPEGVTVGDTPGSGTNYSGGSNKEAKTYVITDFNKSSATITATARSNAGTPYIITLTLN